MILSWCRFLIIQPEKLHNIWRPDDPRHISTTISTPHPPQIYTMNIAHEWAITSHFMLIPLLTHSLTHWGWYTMATIFQTTFSKAVSWMKMNEFRLQFHWRLFLGVQLKIFQHWFRWWLGTKPLSEPTMVRLPMHILVTRSQWINGNTALAYLGGAIWAPQNKLDLTLINSRWIELTDANSTGQECMPLG